MVSKTLYCNSCGKLFRLVFSDMDQKRECTHCGSSDFISAYKIGKDNQSYRSRKEETENKDPGMDEIEQKIDKIRK